MIAFADLLGFYEKILSIKVLSSSLEGFFFISSSVTYSFMAYYICSLPEYYLALVRERIMSAF